MASPSPLDLRTLDVLVCETEITVLLCRLPQRWRGSGAGAAMKAEQHPGPWDTVGVLQSSPQSYTVYEVHVHRTVGSGTSPSLQTVPDDPRVGGWRYVQYSSWKVILEGGSHQEHLRAEAGWELAWMFCRGERAGRSRGSAAEILGTTQLYRKTANHILKIG